MRYLRVKIARDTLTVYGRELPPWEIPVLEAIHEPGNVEIGDAVTFERDYPDHRAEFDRLIQAYGSDPQSGVPYVVTAYGTGMSGPRALETAIEQAKAHELAEKGAPAPVKAARGGARKLSPADALLG